MDNHIRIFVYGSLKRGYFNNSLLRHAKFVSEVKTSKGFTLIDLGCFPAMIKIKTESYVLGELWLVSKDILYRLDDLEGHPYFYRRQSIQLEDDTKAYAYVIETGFRSLKKYPVIGPVWENTRFKRKRYDDDHLF